MGTSDNTHNLNACQLSSALLPAQPITVLQPTG
jgi:hypothetical protein